MLCEGYKYMKVKLKLILSISRNCFIINLPNSELN